MNGLVPVVGGAVVAAGLTGCVAGDDEDATSGESPVRRMAYRPVRLRPGMRYVNVMPRTVPAVRLRGV